MRSVRSLVVVALAVFPAAAQAAMTYVPDTGTVARSRGGAFTAAADDPMAIVYNPAGFADQKKMQVYIDLTALRLNSTFARASDDNDNDGTETSYKKVTNSGAMKISPNIIFSQPVGEKLVWHVGTYGAMGVNQQYPKSGAQRYTTSLLEPQQLSYGGGVAYRFNPMIAAGFTIGGMYITNTTEVTVSSVVPPDPPSEDPAGDIYAVLEVSNPFTPTGNLGLKFTPTPGWEFGLSYRPPVTANLDGTYKANYVSSGNEAANEKVTLIIPLPQIIRTGARKVGTGWDVELDFVIEDWTTRDKDIIDAKDGQIGTTPKIIVDREGKMAFSVRLGGSYKVMDKLQMHAGVLHETSGIPKNRISVNVFDAPKTGLGLGASYGIGERFTVSGNLAYLMVSPQTITESEVRQRSPFGTEPGSLNTVGNGKYQGAYTFAGLSFNTKF